MAILGYLFPLLALPRYSLAIIIVEVRSMLGIFLIFLDRKFSRACRSLAVILAIRSYSPKIMLASQTSSSSAIFLQTSLSEPELTLKSM